MADPYASRREPPCWTRCVRPAMLYSVTGRLYISCTGRVYRSYGTVCRQARSLSAGADESLHTNLKTRTPSTRFRYVCHYLLHCHHYPSRGSVLQTKIKQPVAPRRTTAAPRTGRACRTEAPASPGHTPGRAGAPTASDTYGNGRSLLLCAATSAIRENASRGLLQADRSRPRPTLPPHPGS
jgi:hypothetical protein